MLKISSASFTHHGCTLEINIVEYYEEKIFFLKALPCVPINLFIIQVFIRNIVAGVSL